MDSGLSWPLFMQGKFENATLYVLNVPDNFADLYNLPVEVLNKIREVANKNIGFTLESPCRVSLLLYDNNTFVIYSFNDKTAEMNAVFT